MSNIIEFTDYLDTHEEVEVEEQESEFYDEMLRSGFFIYEEELGEKRTLLNVSEIIPELDYISLPFDINEVVDEDFKNDIIATLVERWEDNADNEIVTVVETKANTGVVFPENCWIILDDFEGELIQSFNLYVERHVKASSTNWFTRVCGNLGLKVMNNAYELDILEMLADTEFDEDEYDDFD